MSDKEITSNGFFVTLEGIDGSGKTTQALQLAEALAKKSYVVVYTREPGGTKLAEFIRTILLDVRNAELCARAELFLYLAARAQHVEQIIKPALSDGKIVVSDRFSDSSVAYQGCGRALGENEVAHLTDFAAAHISPSLTFLLDLPVEAALARMKTAGRNFDRMENEKVDFMHTIRHAYLRIASALPQRFVVLDATENVHVLGAQILHHVEQKLREKAQRELFQKT